MNTLFEICSPRPEILKGDIRESDFPADLVETLQTARLYFLFFERGGEIAASNGNWQVISRDETKRIFRE
ncbi:MAG: hypothetical protein N2235_14070 [Fischerella sp.]|nr:hypothetical protein [Fischerella sp.]